VGHADRLGPDCRHAEVDQDGCREDAGLDVGADADDGAVELSGADLAQRFLARGVGFHDVREAARVALHDLVVGIDGEDLAAELGQRLGDGPAETPKPEDEDAVAVVGVSQ